VSSVDFRGLRPTSNDPLLALFVELQKSVLKRIRDDQVELLDSDNEDIFSDGQDMETAIKYHTISSQQKFTFDKKFYPTFEPDGKYVTLYLKGTSLGNTLKDRSGFNNTTSIYGDPTLIESQFDPGIHTFGTKSIAMRMNRQTSDFENLEWLQVPDAAGIRVAGQATGFSIFTRFQLYSLEDQDGRARTIFEKIDDSTPNDAMMLQVKDDGKLVFIVKDGGVTYAKETVPALTPPFSVYDVFVTYSVSGNVIHIYVDGVDQTLANFTGTVNWQTTLTNHDLFIFRRGLGEDGGFVNGDFFNLKYYREMVVSQAQVTNHWTNKITISDIPYGQCMITNYWATFGGGGVLPGLCSFSATSFSAASFNICGPGGIVPPPLAPFEDDSFESDSFETGV